MAERTGISWTDHTFNPWIGCQKVSEGCRNCYAEALTLRRGWTQWGPSGKRVRTAPSTWKQPERWNRKAAEAGDRARVFCASLADVFDTQAPPGALADLWDLIRRTPALDWQLLTKRPDHIARSLPRSWGPAGWPNVWLGVTAENQHAYDTRWPTLAAIPAAVRFISYEPAVGPLTLAGHPAAPDWLIWGGESGPGARHMELKWAREIVAECHGRGVAVFGKQWGTYRTNPLVRAGAPLFKVRAEDPHGQGGALLDGRLVRQFPVARI